MIKFEFGNQKEIDFIETELDLYNKQMKKVVQNEDYKKFSVVAKKNNKIIGGGVAYSSLYYIGYIDTLWVSNEFKNQSIGSHILNDLEKRMYNYGCEMCHVDTFDFQAPKFYQKNGYEIFGELFHSKQNLREYFLKKNLVDFYENEST
ncbi:GNAT family N-acetyltransferase [Ruoffia tabacinasalis]|uniref:GNAT family N-acetyltransferase n=1 Tax=Ruoffia tabacinasalis TaxID=87458 RepID=UPI0030D20305